MRSARPRPHGRRWWKVLLWSGPLLVLLAWAGAYVATWWWLRREERAWSRDFEPTAAILARHPASGANATAERLADLCAPLGIDLRKGAEPPSDVRAVTSWIVAVGNTTDDDSAPRPEPVRAYLAVYAKDLLAIRALLLDEPTPRWAVDLARDYEQPLSPGLALRPLNAILLAAALDADARGEPADPWLDASLRSSDGLRSRTDSLSQLVEIGLSHMRCGVLRRLARPSPTLSDRMTAHDFRAAFAVAYQMEVHTLRAYVRTLHGVTDLGGPIASGWGHVPIRVATAPYVRASVADASGRVRILAADLRRADPCHVDLDTRTREFAESIPRWNILGRIALSSFVKFWSLVAGAELDAELGRVVVSARGAPDPGPVASKVCSGLVWAPSAGADGAVTFEAHGAGLPERANSVDWSYRMRAGTPAPTPRSR